MTSFMEAVELLALCQEARVTPATARFLRDQEKRLRTIRLTDPAIGPEALIDIDFLDPSTVWWNATNRLGKLSKGTIAFVFDTEGGVDPETGEPLVAVVDVSSLNKAAEAQRIPGALARLYKDELVGNPDDEFYQKAARHPVGKWFVAALVPTAAFARWIASLSGHVAGGVRQIYNLVRGVKVKAVLVPQSEVKGRRIVNWARHI